MEEDEDEGGKDSAASSVRSTRSGRTNNGSTKGQKKAAARSALQIANQNHHTNPAVNKKLKLG